jgi:hypothetical protein
MNLTNPTSLNLRHLQLFPYVGTSVNLKITETAECGRGGEARRREMAQ